MIGCTQDEYNRTKINEVEILTNKNISKEIEDQFIITFGGQLSEDTKWIKVDHIIGLKLDSSHFSYLVSVRTSDTLSKSEEEYLQAFAEAISDNFKNKPIHYFLEANEKYLEYDTTHLQTTGELIYGVKEKFIINTSSEINGHTVGAIWNVIVLALTEADLYDRKIKSRLTKEEDQYILSIELEESNAKLFKEILESLDEFYMFLAIQDEDLLIKYVDKEGNQLTNGSFYDYP